MIGILVGIVTWRKASTSVRLLTFILFLFYFIPEASPTKPAPDDIRYMLPVHVLLLQFVGHSIAFCWRSFAGLTGLTVKMATLFVFLLSLLSVGDDTIRLVANLESDTRSFALMHVQEKFSHQKVLWGRLSGGKQLTLGRRFEVEDLIMYEADFVVLSSFHYERYREASNWPGQDESVYAQARVFAKIFTMPYIEISPKHRSFAFSNPTIRIVDVRSLRRKEPPQN
jgi:hypothetical protein